MMKTVSADDLVTLFQRMYKEHWAYTMGAAEEGNVDCSGAFVYAFSHLGAGSIPHGSNSIYRQSIGWVSETQAVPGYAAFKIRNDNQEPSKYKSDGIGNVYHIGLVDSDGKHVLNAKGSKYGFCRDDLKGWTCFAPLKKIDYGDAAEESEEPMAELYKATVCTQTGPLSLREGKSTSTKRLAMIPKGKTVSVTAEDDNGWTRVQYDGNDGYVMSNFIEKVEENSTDTDAAMTTLINDAEGQTIRLAGSWRVAGND